MKKNNSRKLPRYLTSILFPTENEEVSNSAKDNIAQLASLTRKKWHGRYTKSAHDAAAELHSTAAFAVEILTSLCKARPELFKGIAREKFDWPVMYLPHPDMMRRTAALLRNLELGRNTQINLSTGRTFSWRAPANIVALNLHELAQRLRRTPMRSWDILDLRSIALCSDTKSERQLKALEAWGQHGAGKQLPPLSKQTADQWATVTKELFRIAYPGNFEEHPNLQELGASVSKRAKDYSGKVGGRGVVRKAMLQAVKQAWHSIAALD